MLLEVEVAETNGFELKFLIKQAFIISSSISIFMLSSIVIAVFNVVFGVVESIISLLLLILVESKSIIMCQHYF